MPHSAKDDKGDPPDDLSEHEWAEYNLPAALLIRIAAAVEGSEQEKRRAFSNAFIYLYNRINIFTSLPIEKLDRMRLQRKLDDIGTARE